MTKKNCELAVNALAEMSRKNDKIVAPAGNRTRVCTVAGYYSTTRPLVLVDNEGKLKCTCDPAFL